MKHTKRILGVMCLCALMMTVTYPVTTKVNAASVEQDAAINKTKLSLKLGQQKKLQVNGTTSAVTWSSSNPKVVRVTKRGIVKSRRVGNAVVTAMVGKDKFTCEVMVKEPVIIMEEYEKNYYQATYSDGFVVGATTGEIEFEEDYKSYNVWAAYDIYVGAVYEQPLTNVVVKGYNSKSKDTFKRVIFEQYASSWCDFQKKIYQQLDFDYNLNEYGKYFCMVDGYIVFPKKDRINTIKYNDGIHKLNLYL